MAEEKKEVKDGKVVVQVTQATVSKRKATIGERLAKTFLSEENVDNVGDYLLNDVVIPAIKDTIVDFIQKGTDMLFYGETKSRSGRRRGADDRELQPYLYCRRSFFEQQKHRWIFQARLQSCISRVRVCISGVQR